MEPLFYADWLDTLMVHLEVEPEPLQAATPFPLDRWNGQTFVTLVFFTLRRMRPCQGGALGRWLMRPFASDVYLNVRTYVRSPSSPETGIYFLAEWLSNPGNVLIGPRLFGLPFRWGQLDYQNADADKLHGHVIDRVTRTQVSYEGSMNSTLPLAPCESGTLDEWLMERYTAFTHGRGRPGFFRIWHPPWPQRTVDARLTQTGLLRHVWPWMADACVTGAQYSPGVRDVWMGRPHRL